MTCTLTLKVGTLYQLVLKRSTIVHPSTLNFKSTCKYYGKGYARGMQYYQMVAVLQSHNKQRTSFSYFKP